MGKVESIIELKNYNTDPRPQQWKRLYRLINAEETYVYIQQLLAAKEVKTSSCSYFKITTKIMSEQRWHLTLTLSNQKSW